jgi:hypothetical protein
VNRVYEWWLRFLSSLASLAGITLPLGWPVCTSREGVGAMHRGMKKEAKGIIVWSAIQDFSLFDEVIRT